MTSLRCTRTACRAVLDGTQRTTFYHRDTAAPYCSSCAIAINRASRIKLVGNPRPTADAK